MLSRRLGWPRQCQGVANPGLPVTDRRYGPGAKIPSADHFAPGRAR
jgi:hypothetical protein